MPNIGLVLSGGMVKGAYQIGALQAINEIFSPSDICYASAASVGALNTYAYLTQGLTKGVELWSTINSNNNRRFIATLLKNCFLQDAIGKIITDTNVDNIFYVPLVNLKKRTLLYVDIGKVSPENVELYLRASVAMPAFNSGVEINGNRFYDGAMIDNIPIYPILKHQLDYVICIYFDKYNYTFESNYLDNKVIKVNFTDSKIVSSSICFTSESIKCMIGEGYAKTKRILDFIFVNGTSDLPGIYARIEDLNAMNTNRSLRITGDILVDNMNKITKKFMKKTTIH